MRPYGPPEGSLTISLFSISYSAHICAIVTHMTFAQMCDITYALIWTFPNRILSGSAVNQFVTYITIHVSCVHIDIQFSFAGVGLGTGISLGFVFNFHLGFGSWFWVFVTPSFAQRRWFNRSRLRFRCPILHNTLCNAILLCHNHKDQHSHHI